MRLPFRALEVLLMSGLACAGGCGRSQHAEALRQAPACSFISSAEMAELLGAPVGKAAEEDMPGTSSCLYPPGEAGSFAQADIAIEWDHGKAPSEQKQLADAFGESAAGRTVAHDVRLGDESSYSVEGALSIRLGNALIIVTLPMRPDSEQRAVAIGRKLLERMG